LEELGLRKHFGPVCGGDEVPVVKPDPALYRLALERLGVRAEEAVALEDSANGVRAAKRAGLRCVAVPNRITAGLDFSEADLKVASLAAFTLDDLFRRFETTVPTKP
ncbi:MAG: HAD family hydrolase, partial [Puniceicoccaceae bacterium]